MMDSNNYTDSNYINNLFLALLNKSFVRLDYAGISIPKASRETENEINDIVDWLRPKNNINKFISRLQLIHKNGFKVRHFQYLRLNALLRKREAEINSSFYSNWIDKADEVLDYFDNING